MSKYLGVVHRRCMAEVPPSSYKSRSSQCSKPAGIDNVFCAHHNRADKKKLWKPSGEKNEFRSR